MAQPGPALEVQDVAHAFGGVQAVRGVSLQVEAGRFVGLIGPNGAGKTTLLDCISGVIHNYRGRIRFGGRDVTGWRMDRIASLGLVRTFQASRIFGRMSVLSNLMAGPRRQRGETLAAALAGGWQAEDDAHLAKARGLLDRVSMEASAQLYGSELSGGQRRMAELSRALMTGPSMLLLDEPFAGVSPTNRARLAGHLQALCRNEGITILMIEHRLELVEQLCENIYVMAEGRILAEGTMSYLRQHAGVVAAYLGEVRGDGA